MKNTITNRVNMLRATLTHCDENSAATSGIVAFATVKTSADNKLVLIDSLTIIANGTTGGVTLDTNILRLTMSNLALKCGDAVSAYAASVNNNTLRAKVTTTLYALNRLKKEEVDDKCQEIQIEANTHIAAAGAFGYTASDVTDLQTAITLYRTASQNPRHAIISRSEAISDIKLLVRETIDNLFEKQMDKMVNTLRATNIQFVNTYFRHREIIDLGTTHAKVRGTVKDPNDVPLIGVTFIMRKTGQQNITAETQTILGGKFGVYDVQADNYDFYWQFPGYQTIIETNVKISAGKEIRRKITMQSGTNQIVTIQGIVRDNVTMQPIAGVLLNIGGHTTLSGPNGAFQLQFVATEVTTLPVSITKAGYDTYTTTQQFSPGETLTQDITMQRIILTTYQQLMGASATINLGTLTAGATALRITLINGTSVEVGLSTNTITLEGTPVTANTVGAATDYLLNTFGITANNILAHNLNTTDAATIKVEVLG